MEVQHKNSGKDIKNKMRTEHFISTEFDTDFYLSIEQSAVDIFLILG